MNKARAKAGRERNVSPILYGAIVLYCIHTRHTQFNAAAAPRHYAVRCIDNANTSKACANTRGRLCGTRGNNSRLWVEKWGGVWLSPVAGREKKGWRTPQAKGNTHTRTHTTHKDERIVGTTTSFMEKICLVTPTRTDGTKNTDTRGYRFGAGGHSQ